MPIPNMETASALIESYLNIRMKENKEWKLPDDPKVLHKKGICTQLLVEFQQARKINDWMEIVNDLAERERAEEAEKLASQPSLSILVWVTAWFKDRPLLFETMQAVRIYIIKQIKSENEFKQHKEDLVKEKAILENNILDGKKANVSKENISVLERQLSHVREQLDALDDSKDYLTSFFNEVIKVRDPQALQLKEASFKDFEGHITDKSRIRKDTRILLAASGMNTTKTIKIALADKPVQLSVVNTVPAVGQITDIKIDEKKIDIKKPEESKPEEKKLEQKKSEVAAEPEVKIPVSHRGPTEPKISTTVVRRSHRKSVQHTSNMPYTDVMPSLTKLSEPSGKMLRSSTKQHAYFPGIDADYDLEKEAFLPNNHIKFDLH